MKIAMLLTVFVIVVTAFAAPGVASAASAADGAK